MPTAVTPKRETHAFGPIDAVTMLHADPSQSAASVEREAPYVPQLPTAQMWLGVTTANEQSGSKSPPGSPRLGVAAMLHHGSNQMEELVDGVLIKRENGQLLLIKIPGS